MSSKPNSIRLSDHKGKIFDASDYIPLDIAEETAQMDSLGNKSGRFDEIISNRLSQEQLLMLCDELKNPEITPKTREAIQELLSLYGFKCNKLAAEVEPYEEEVYADDTTSSSKFLSIDEVVDMQIARQRTSKHISKF